MGSELRDINIMVRVAATTEPTPVAAPHSKQRPTIIVYPTISPETVVIPIVSCIFGFPLLALLVICCLRRRAKLARERDRRRAGNCEADAGAMSLVRFSPMHRLGRELQIYLQPYVKTRSKTFRLLYSNRQLNLYRNWLNFTDLHMFL